MSVDAGLRSLFRKHLPQVDFLAVETPSTSRGVADMNYCFAGAEGWIEMKRAEGHKVRVSPEQVGWAERRLDHGGRVLVAVRKVLARSDSLTLLWGDQLRSLRDELPLTEVPAIGTWTGGPARWDWKAVLQAMTCPSPRRGTCQEVRGAMTGGRL